MTGTTPIVECVRAALEPHGVFVRGVVNFSDGEEAPVFAGGGSARAVILLGNIGGSVWPHFTRWREEQTDGGGSDPFDNWSKAVIRPVAEKLGGTAWFPSDPPWQPFQQWAMKAEGLKPSPLGILIHPEYGLWHGYRAAIGFGVRLPEPERPTTEHPCDDCVGKPCMSHCPADAVSADGFDLASCRRWLKTSEGKTGCMVLGCFARNACPVGARYRYPAEQLRFHMRALKI